MKFYDTCSLLSLLDDAFDEEFVCSSKTLQEIESIKTSDRKDQSIKYRARRLARLLDENVGKYDVIIPNNTTFDILKEFQLETTPDNIIMASAYAYNKNYKPIDFYSDDICCKLIAGSVFGLNVKSVNNDNKIEYKGYTEKVMSDVEMAYFYENLDKNIYDLLTNEYLVVKNENGEVIDKLKWTGLIHRTISYKQINNDFVGRIKPRNVHQELAFDLLQDRDITIKVLTGIFGSGKDFLMASTAIDLIKQKKFDKIMWVRNNVEVKNSKPIGFLPNGIKDKLLPFAMPLADHVGGKDGLELLIQQDKIEIEHLGFIRGRDIKNTIIICSESENMTKEHIQLLVSRVSDGSVLWLNGDFRQIDNNIFESNNGLNHAINKLASNEKFGYVQLQKTERSETASLSDLLD